LRCRTVEKADVLDDGAKQGAASEAAPNVRTDRSVASAGARTRGSAASEAAASRRSGDSARSGQTARVASVKSATSVASVASILKATFGGEVATASEAVCNAREEAEHPHQQHLCRWDASRQGRSTWQSPRSPAARRLRGGCRGLGVWGWPPWSRDRQDLCANK
jgi:hypothetical protein